MRRPRRRAHRRGSSPIAPPRTSPGRRPSTRTRRSGRSRFIASFEYRDGSLTSDVRASWLGYQIAIGLGLLLAFGLSLLSMREPLAEIGTGVPFYAGSVPENLTLMEVDRAVAIEQAGDRIKERTASLQHKLDASEAARLRAEGRLQQALAALAQPGRRSVMPVPQSTAVKSDVVKIPEPSVVAPPEPERRWPPRRPSPLLGHAAARWSSRRSRGHRGGLRSGSRSRFRLRSPFRRRPSSKRRSRSRSSERPSPRRRAGRRNAAARAGSHRASTRAGPDRSAARPDHHAGARSRGGSRRSSRAMTADPPRSSSFRSSSPWGRRPGRSRLRTCSTGWWNPSPNTVPPRPPGTFAPSWREPPRSRSRDRKSVGKRTSSTDPEFPRGGDRSEWCWHHCQPPGPLRRLNWRSRCQFAC